MKVSMCSTYGVHYTFVKDSLVDTKSLYFVCPKCMSNVCVHITHANSTLIIICPNAEFHLGGAGGEFAYLPLPLPRISSTPQVLSVSK